MRRWSLGIFGGVDSRTEAKQNAEEVIRNYLHTLKEEIKTKQATWKLSFFENLKGKPNEAEPILQIIKTADQKDLLQLISIIKEVHQLLDNASHVKSKERKDFYDSWLGRMKP